MHNDQRGRAGANGQRRGVRPVERGDSESHASREHVIDGPSSLDPNTFSDPHVSAEARRDAGTDCHASAYCPTGAYHHASAHGYTPTCLNSDTDADCEPNARADRDSCADGPADDRADGRADGGRWR